MATTTKLITEHRQKRGSAHGATKSRSSQTGEVGTPYYIAPELKNEASLSNYGKEADIYSLGIIFFEMHQYHTFTTGSERIKIVNEARKEMFPDFIQFSDDFLSRVSLTRILFFKICC